MLLGALLAMTVSMAPKVTDLYVGTYTEPKGSKGIYRLRLNLETGALATPQLAAEATAPSYLCLRPDGKFMYAVNEYSEGEATAFAVESGGLRKLNTVKFEGKGPCHVSTDPSGKWLFVSAYGGGTVTVLSVKSDGSIGGGVDVFKNSGSGPNQKRQAGAHLHFAGVVGSHLYACDLGTDQVLHFDMNTKTGQLKQGLSASTEAGVGPRHFVASRDGTFLYANNEMGMGVAVFRRDPSTGALRLIQTHPSIEGLEAKPDWTTAAIKMHPKLPVLYVSNRGHNSISIFDLQGDGSVAWRSVVELDVLEPRDFEIEPSGRWMVVAGQKSGEIQSLRIDGKTGSLEGTRNRAKILKPVCVVFAR